MHIELTLGRQFWRYLLALCSVSLLVGCQQTLHANSRTAITSNDSQQSVSDALQRIVGLPATAPDNSAMLYICSTVPGSFTCTDAPPGGKTKDMGLIPATLSLSAIELSNLEATSAGWVASMQLRPAINGVSPWCRRGQMRIELAEDDRISASLDSTWCNWLLLGNASVALSFSVEEISPNEAAFAGFYTLHVKGTSTFASSGYLLARAK